MLDGASAAYIKVIMSVFLPISHITGGMSVKFDEFMRYLTLSPVSTSSRIYLRYDSTKKSKSEENNKIEIRSESEIELFDYGFHQIRNGQDQ